MNKQQIHERMSDIETRAEAEATAALDMISRRLQDAAQEVQNCRAAFKQALGAWDYDLAISYLKQALLRLHSVTADCREGDVMNVAACVGALRMLSEIEEGRRLREKTRQRISP